MELNSLELTHTRPLTRQGSTFQGFCCLKLLSCLPSFLHIARFVLQSPRLVTSCVHTMLLVAMTPVMIMNTTGACSLQNCFINVKEKEQTSLCLLQEKTGPDLLGAQRFDIIRTLVLELFQIMADRPSNPLWMLDGLHNHPPSC